MVLAATKNVQKVDRCDAVSGIKETNMKDLAEAIWGPLLLWSWAAGLVIAKGFWSTVIAALFPPWGLYLLVEQWLKVIGWAPA